MNLSCNTGGHVYKMAVTVDSFEIRYNFNIFNYEYICWVLFDESALHY